MAVVSHGAPRHGRGRVLCRLSAGRAAPAVRGAPGQSSSDRLHGSHSEALPPSTHLLVRSVRRHHRAGCQSTNTRGRHPPAQHQHPLARAAPPTCGGGRHLRPAAPAHRPRRAAGGGEEQGAPERQGVAAGPPGGGPRSRGRPSPDRRRGRHLHRPRALQAARAESHRASGREHPQHRVAGSRVSLAHPPPRRRLRGGSAHARRLRELPPGSVSGLVRPGQPGADRADYFKPVTNRVNLFVRKGTLGATGTFEYAPTAKSVHLDKVVVRGPEIEYLHTPQTAAAESARADATVSAAKKASNNPELELQVDRLEIAKGRFGFVNKAAAPPYHLTLTDATLTVENLSNQRVQGPSTIRLSGKFMGSGQIQASATMRPAKAGADLDLKVSVEDTEMTSMNDVVRAYGKFGVSQGQFSLFSELKVTDGNITGYVKPLFRDVRVGGDQPDESKSFSQKVRERVIAVLASILKNHPRGEVATVVTISGRVDQPQTRTWEAIGGLLRNAFLRAILPGFEFGRGEKTPEPPKP